MCVVKGQASTHVKAGKQLPKHATSGFRSMQIQVIVSDDEPAQILGFFQLPNLIFLLVNFFLTSSLKHVAFRSYF